MEAVTALRDDSGHWYVIPSTLLPKWNALTEIMEDDNQSAFEKAQDEFIDTFDKYRTGGDLNNVQLYAEM